MLNSIATTKRNTISICPVSGYFSQVSVNPGHVMTPAQINDVSGLTYRSASGPHADSHPGRDFQPAIGIRDAQRAADRNAIRLSIAWWTQTSRPNHGCHQYKSSRNPVLWALSSRVVQRNKAAPVIGQRCAGLSPGFSGSEASNRSPSSADCFTTMPRSRFSVHTRYNRSDYPSYSCSASSADNIQKRAVLANVIVWIIKFRSEYE
jgi:hypothetical protein